MKFYLNVIFVPGKAKLIADYLSCHPKWSSNQPIANDIWGKDQPIEAIVCKVSTKRYLRKLDDPFLTTINNFVTEDEDYIQVMNHLKNKAPRYN